jgi:hypothetical protein
MPAKRPAGEPESFKDVKAALDKALGKPKKSGPILRYKAPPDSAAWIKRVHATGAFASLAEAYPARELAVVVGPPSQLMGLVTYVSWRTKSGQKALEMLHADAGVRISNINYTNFVISLDRVPADVAGHARRLAKIIMQGDEDAIAAALKKRKLKTR